MERRSLLPRLEYGVGSNGKIRIPFEQDFVVDAKRSSCRYLFAMLDVDQAGWVGLDEFVDGILRVVQGSVTNDRHMLVGDGGRTAL